ncbi:aldo/keto reductase [Arthrobacter sp. STN4]|uniref:aldo/keto reductase n=1 Tax=Arthrobacter sp. STN4 TaxID=2923276 RepID=UPI00211A041E|nr:aldo/keto reductase [Arthrobacter sp. STN4]MCQ9163968.1 aldo/keto reductase [Arthrobacter sp. STN4]
MQELIPDGYTQLPMLGFGTLPLAGVYGPIRESDAVAIINKAIELGVKFVDTADAYGDGLAELIIGRAIAGRHDEVTVATKVGLVAGGRGGVQNDRSYLRRAVGASLSRLGVERIDLLFLHRVDPKVPIEETIGFLAELVREGSVAGIGLSCRLPAGWDHRVATSMGPLVSVI